MVLGDHFQRAHEAPFEQILNGAAALLADVHVEPPSPVRVVDLPRLWRKVERENAQLDAFVDED